MRAWGEDALRWTWVAPRAIGRGGPRLDDHPCDHAMTLPHGFDILIAERSLFIPLGHRSADPYERAADRAPMA